MSPGGFFQQNWAIHLLMDLAQEYDYEMRKRRTEEIFK